MSIQSLYIVYTMSKQCLYVYCLSQEAERCVSVARAMSAIHLLNVVLSPARRLPAAPTPSVLPPAGIQRGNPTIRTGRIFPNQIAGFSPACYTNRVSYSKFGRGISAGHPPSG